MKLTQEQIDILKNWDKNAWPNRAYKWAQFMWPMKDLEYEPGMTENQIKWLNRTAPKYQLFDNGKPHVVAYDKFLRMNKKEFLDFLAEYKIKKTAYENAL